MARTLLPAFLTLLLTGCAATTPVESVNRAHIEFRPASFTASDSAERMTEPDAQRPVYVSSTPILTDADFVSASITKDDQGKRAVALTLSDDAANRFFNYTRAHINEPIAILVDGKLISAPTVLSALNQHAIITGGGEGLTEPEAQRIISAVRRR